MNFVEAWSKNLITWQSSSCPAELPLYQRLVYFSQAAVIFSFKNQIICIDCNIYFFYFHAFSSINPCCQHHTTSNNRRDQSPTVGIGHHNEEGNHHTQKIHNATIQ